MKALGLVVSDKKISENCILKTYFLTPWPTYATNWNGFNNFDRGPPRDHSCEVWSKSNKRFQRRCCLKKLLTHARTDARTRGWRTPDIEWSQKLTEHFVLRWANNGKLNKRLWTSFCLLKSHMNTIYTKTAEILIACIKVHMSNVIQSNNLEYSVFLVFTCIQWMIWVCKQQQSTILPSHLLGSQTHQAGWAAPTWFSGSPALHPSWSRICHRSIMQHSEWILYWFWQII